MKKVFAEIGYGNGSFFSTEFESRSAGDFIVSTNEGFKIQKKDRNRLKILLGVGGTI